MTWSAACGAAGNSASVAARTRPPRTRLICVKTRTCVMTISDGLQRAMEAGISRLRRDPHGVTHHDRPRDQPQPMETIRDRLLACDDVVGQLADRKRPAACGDDLDVELDSGHVGERVRPL